MLAVLRQVALTAHYPNYVEYDAFEQLVCRNRTVITLISDKDAASIVSELEKEENLCNLLKYCKHSVYGNVNNDDSYIDIELEITHEPSEDKEAVYICEDDFKLFLEAKPENIYSVDTRKAVFASRVYDLGALIDNLPAEDIHCAKRYNTALNAFKYTLLENAFKPLVDEQKWKNNLTKVKNGLSNIFCADCFESRARGIKKFAEEEGLPEKDAWEKNAQALSCSEHSRWVVEKLIMGFHPLSISERLAYESYFGDKRKAFAKQLKSNSSSPAHIDLCSYRDLRRINPDDLKYDSFLMLAIRFILEKTDA
jgi:hypothetical protein